MNNYEPRSPREMVPDRPVSSATSGAPVAGPRLLSNRRSRWIMVAVLMCAVIGLAAACGTSSATATSPSATAAGSGASNARSGPASGGASGTVDSVSTSSFTMSTSAGQKVTVDEASSTTYQKGTTSTSASAITAGQYVLVLGTTSGTTITATQVIVQPTGGGSATSSAALMLAHDCLLYDVRSGGGYCDSGGLGSLQVLLPNQSLDLPANQPFSNLRGGLPNDALLSELLQVRNHLWRGSQVDPSAGALLPF